MDIDEELIKDFTDDIEKHKSKFGELGIVGHDGEVLLLYRILRELKMINNKLSNTEES